MLVLKFGGTSVASALRIKNIVNIVKERLNEQPILVVSALSGVTQALIDAANLPINKRSRSLKEIQTNHHKLAKELFTNKIALDNVINFIDSKIKEAKKMLSKNKLNLAELDRLVSLGEILSSYIITEKLNQKGINSKQIIATDLIVTNDNFTAADFLPKETERKVKKILLPLIKQNIVPVVTGFIGATKKGKITTLGRGGSDYSASILGYALKAKEVQIWTDVDGVFSGDPKVVKDALLIPEISFREASEMAAFGAKVLHPRTIRPAVARNIPVMVLNSFNPKGLGTLITNKKSNSQSLRSISFKRKVTLVNIYSTDMLFSKGFLARIFAEFSKEDISIDLVSVSEVSVSVTLDNDENLNKVIKRLNTFSSVTTTQMGMVSLIGEGIIESNGYLREVFAILERENIHLKMISLGASDINISLVVNLDDTERTVRLLHSEILLRQPRKNNLENKTINNISFAQ